MRSMRTFDVYATSDTISPSVLTAILPLPGFVLRQLLRKNYENRNPAQSGHGTLCLAQNQPLVQQQDRSRLCGLHRDGRNSLEYRPVKNPFGILKIDVVLCKVRLPLVLRRAKGRGRKSVHRPLCGFCGEACIGRFCAVCVAGDCPSACSSSCAMESTRLASFISTWPTMTAP